MIEIKKIYKSFKFSLYLSLLIIFSCDESNSIILNPPNSNDFKVKSFIIDADSSFSYRESQFNAGNSERIYLGKIDDNTESMLLFKIHKELISNNNLCQEDGADFNNLEYPPSIFLGGLNLSSLGIILSAPVPVSFTL